MDKIKCSDVLLYTKIMDLIANYDEDVEIDFKKYSLSDNIPIAYTSFTDEQEYNGDLQVYVNLEQQAVLFCKEDNGGKDPVKTITFESLSEFHKYFLYIDFDWLVAEGKDILDEYWRNSHSK